MRIAFLLYGSLDTVTGGFLYDRCLVDYLRARGEEVDVISLPWKSCGYGLLDNFHLTPEKVFHGKRYDLLIEDALAFPSLLRLNRTIRREHRLPILSVLHSLRSNETRPAWQRPGLLAIERSYLHSLDGLIFNSKTTLRDAEAAAGRKLEGVVAYPGKDRLQGDLSAEEIATRTFSPRLQILFAGNLTRHKGLHVLLDALARLPRSQRGGWRLAIAGSEWMEPGYVRSIRARVLTEWSENVAFLGSLDSRRMAKCFSGSHLLVVPSAHEGFGMVYLEAMGFGLPAVGTWSGAAREIIRDGENGFLIDPGDSGLLSHRISTLISDRGRLKKMSLESLKTHGRFPSWSESMALVHTFLSRFSIPVRHALISTAGDLVQSPVP